MRKASSRGFTLIEVLLASVILFTVLSVMTVVYRQATLSSLKAESTVQASSQLMFIVDNIAERLHTQTSASSTQGQGSFLGVQYQWSAEPAMRRQPTKRLDPVTGIEITPQRWFTLWRVDLTVKVQQQTRKYQYQELTWTPN
ncbi:type IV pilus modification PilV family protein [Ferrimonas aestuarii]|uniref:Prepilin-type N-terminal cleavage/methylation domain-containing protein n=1 Tax=Ferrimonas aestuarii TaxID=2569539 RepID=A0A4U1BMH8_9GAMM|nr:prepilin-type N-terminal cleavage/methylation domain-containing protein [Ferrimonas aestuarii]TKB53945.1 prepilin-type N-terminal cleavage/methylation domain-containing protein [Ferrimonas aestuarii]